MELFQRSLMRIHHVPRLIELKFDIVLQFGWNLQMVHLVDAFVERRGQVEIPAFNITFRSGLYFIASARSVITLAACGNGIGTPGRLVLEIPLLSGRFPA